MKVLCQRFKSSNGKTNTWWPLRFDLTRNNVRWSKTLKSSDKYLWLKLSISKTNIHTIDFQLTSIFSSIWLIAMIGVFDLIWTSYCIFDGKHKKEWFEMCSWFTFSFKFFWKRFASKWRCGS